MTNTLKFYASYCLLVMLIVLIPACNWFGNKIHYKGESAQLRTGLILLNVNDKDSFDDARIKGSIHATYDTLEKQAQGWDKKSAIVTYCTDYACTESHRVAKKLMGLGFENVAVYSGGIREWYQQSDKSKYSIEGKHATPTQDTPRYLTRPVEKFETADDGIKTITVHELSELVAREGK